MPRVARTVISGVQHHVTQRGNNRQDVFFVDDDRRFYLETLKRESAKYDLEIHAYCLMTNHIHIVAVPKNDDSLAMALGRTHLAYTQYLNRFHRRSGHLWQNRYYSCPVDDKSLPVVAWYVETNPVRAGIVRKAWKYEWSSAAAHTGGVDSTGMLQLDAFRRMATAESWKAYLTEREDDMLIETIRAKTSRGRPLGSDSFVSKLETMVGRRLRPLANGRPRKESM